MTINRKPLLALTAAAVSIAAAACSSASPASSAASTSPPAASAPASSASPATAAGGPAAVSLPDTPVGAQARWLFSAAVHPPIPTAAVTAHFDQAFLAKAPAAELNQVLAGVKTVKLDAVTLSTASDLVMTITENGSKQFKVSMTVDAAGLISGLLLSPAATATAAMPPPPASWAGVDSQVKSAAPQTEMLVAQVSGNTCRPVHASGASTAAPLGSAFKLYVLDALARAVASGKVSWDQPLTVTSQLKSLPSGQLQNEPDGTKVTVQQATDAMISISDNTAANMLMALLGQPAIEAAAAASGLAKPSLDMPFLSTRELFALKLVNWPKLADSYLADSPAARAALLAGTIDHEPYSALTGANSAAWVQPRDINSLEWFASPTDICHVYASLAQLASEPKLAPVATALQISDGGLGLDTTQWRTVWYKGGSEPGVVTLNYLATTRGGKTYMVSVLTANSAAPISTAQSLALLSAVKGAFQLAAA